ncbi:MAG: hypothetical protein ACK53A_00230 [Gemmatimonadota bacterium]|jgi:hypothetical protein|nr:hypothetical protein [Gemmatimonadota bacterium]
MPTYASVMTRASALARLGPRAHLLDSLPLVVDARGCELGFRRTDVEALAHGEYTHERTAALGRVEHRAPIRRRR